jgi:hypothetical protein
MFGIDTRRQVAHVNVFESTAGVLDYQATIAIYRRFWMGKSRALPTSATEMSYSMIATRLKA